MSELDRIRQGDSERRRLDALLEKSKTTPGMTRVIPRGELADKIVALQKRVEELEADKVKLWAIAKFANHLPNCDVATVFNDVCNCRFRETWDALPED